MSGEIMNNENGDGARAWSDREMVLMFLATLHFSPVEQFLASYKALTGRTIDQHSTRTLLRRLACEHLLLVDNFGHYRAAPKRDEFHLMAMLEPPKRSP